MGRTPSKISQRKVLVCRGSLTLLCSVLLVLLMLDCLILPFFDGGFISIVVVTVLDQMDPVQQSLSVVRVSLLVVASRNVWLVSH
jgi:hypothetical protein